MVNSYYVPIIKWKRAEQWAIRNLYDSQKDAVVPLLEIVQPTEVNKTAKKAGFSTVEEIVYTMAKTVPQDILIMWGDGRKFFIDFTLLYPEKPKRKFAFDFLNNALSLNLQAVPVVNLSGDDDEYILDIIAFCRFVGNDSVCIRLTSLDLVDIDYVNSRIKNIIGLDKNQISIIIDLKENTDPKLYQLACVNSQKLIGLDMFQDLIIACGAFPKDMSGFQIDAEENHQDRLDWLNWKFAAYEARLKRLPVFADYTIRHPIYDESVMKHTPTATIKYTLEDRWNIYKGQKKASDQYLAYANILRSEDIFYGATFSAGDAYIDEKGKYFKDFLSSGQTGGTEQWLRAGINHHIAVVVDQLSNLNV